MPSIKGPKFIQYFQPVIDALRELGSSARPKEVYSWIAEHHSISKEDLEATNKGGQSKFENRVAWARFYLAKAGFINTEKRGVWVLTETGRKANLTHEDTYKLFRKLHDEFQRGDALSEKPGRNEETGENVDASAPDEKIYLNQDEIQAELVTLLRSVTDKGFEELCARLLRHIGFENVKVTGQRGDRGVDGEGYLLINRFVRTKVMFQCKRYINAVQAKEVRDFRGAIQGRAERGIFLTTGTFTSGAREEAARENAVAIGLVDIDRLMELLIEESLGVRESKALTIDREFFAPYRQTVEGLVR